MRQHLDEGLFQRIVEGAPDAVIFADREGVIRLWNAGAGAIFGYEAHETLGRSLDLIIPENLRARHWEGYRRVMETGETRHGRQLLAVPVLRKDGSRISLEFSVVLVRDADGAPEGVAAIMRDVTQRWAEQKALKEELAALKG